MIGLVTPHAAAIWSIEMPGPSWRTAAMAESSSSSRRSARALASRSRRSVIVLVGTVTDSNSYPRYGLGATAPMQDQGREDGRDREAERPCAPHHPGISLVLESD